MDMVQTNARVHEIDINQMLDQYGDSLLRMCYVYLKDIHLAEDAMQETFIKAYKHASKFRGESSEKSWLMRIAINVCKDMQRGAWFRRVDKNIGVENLPEALYTCDPQDDTLIVTVMALPRKLKEVVLLKYYQNMKVNEIAEILGIPQGTVATHLAAAKKQLHTKLEG